VVELFKLLGLRDGLFIEVEAQIAARRGRSSGETQVSAKEHL
jgi:hypothetical protein